MTTPQTDTGAFFRSVGIKGAPTELFLRADVVEDGKVAREMGLCNVRLAEEQSVVSVTFHSQYDRDIAAYSGYFAVRVFLGKAHVASVCQNATELRRKPCSRADCPLSAEDMSDDGELSFFASEVSDMHRTLNVACSVYLVEKETDGQSKYYFTISMDKDVFIEIAHGAPFGI